MHFLGYARSVLYEPKGVSVHSHISYFNGIKSRGYKKSRKSRNFFRDFSEKSREDLKSRKN